MPSSNSKPMMMPLPLVDRHSERRLPPTEESVAAKKLARRIDDVESHNRQLRLEVQERDTEIDRARATVAIAREFMEWADKQSYLTPELRAIASGFKDALAQVGDDDVPSELEAREMGAA